MSESIVIAGATKKEKYESLLPQVKALVGGEKDFIANISNVMGALKYGMNFFWVGIYLVKDGDLVLGPFQGTVACTRIGLGKGVCGRSWQEKTTLVVEDVEKFPGHIACSSVSKSEIVVPCFRNGEVFAVLDIDSDVPANFDSTDKLYLEQVAKIIESL